jgi:hypothetical protein
MFLKVLACGLSVIWAKTPSLQQCLVLARDRNQIWVSRRGQNGDGSARTFFIFSLGSFSLSFHYLQNFYSTALSRHISGQSCCIFVE